MLTSIDDGDRVSPETKGLAPRLAQPDKEIPCRKNCGRTFKSKPAESTHYQRAHTKGWVTHLNFKSGRKKKFKKTFASDSPAYRKRKYEERKAMFRAKGMTTEGRPFKTSTNGVLPQETPTDNLSEAARAIILTAQVLRSVSLGLKL